MAEVAKQKVVVQKEKGIADLPPPGDARREELKRRADDLAAEMEKILGELETYGIDPTKLDPKNVDNEVGRATNREGDVFVSNADPAYKYAWIYRDPFNRFGGRFVHSMQALGFEVVNGDMPEAKEHKSVTGERWVADALLMRIRLDKYAQLQIHDKERRLKQQEGIDAELHMKAARHGMRIRDMRSDDKLRHLAGVGEDASVSVTRRIPSSRELRRQFAKQAAQEILTAKLKKGSVPGLPDAPGVRR